LFALPLAALGFRRGLLWIVPFYLVVLPPDAQALDWQTLWRNNDQRASQLFERGEHAAAAELFDNPEWQASSKYRAGDYAAALEAWQQLDDEDATYNRANTLARLERYEDALATYQRLLAQNPAHLDARFNKEALEEWLKNQQQQQQQQGEQGEQAKEQQQSEAGEGQAGDSQQANEKAQNQADSGDPGQQQAPQPEQQEQTRQQQSQQPGEQEQQTMEDEALAELDQKMTQQAAEQWLRKIPDDPGGLLRRKFIYQYRQRGGVDAEAQSW
jgi:Ca-activated chloride channel family protein